MRAGLLLMLVVFGALPRPGRAVGMGLGFFMGYQCARFLYKTSLGSVDLDSYPYEAGYSPLRWQILLQTESTHPLRLAEAITRLAPHLDDPRAFLRLARTTLSTIRRLPGFQGKDAVLKALVESSRHFDLGANARYHLGQMILGTAYDRDDVASEDFIDSPWPERLGRPVPPEVGRIDIKDEMLSFFVRPYFFANELTIKSSVDTLNIYDARGHLLGAISESLTEKRRLDGTNPNHPIQRFIQVVPHSPSRTYLELHRRHYGNEQVRAGEQLQETFAIDSFEDREYLVTQVKSEFYLDRSNPHLNYGVFAAKREGRKLLLKTACYGRVLEAEITVPADVVEPGNLWRVHTYLALAVAQIIQPFLYF